MFETKIPMNLSPSHTKKMLMRLGQWKRKACERAYSLRELRKDFKRLKMVLADIKNTYYELKCQLEALQSEYEQLKQIDDEKIKALEIKIQQLEAEKKDVFKKKFI